MRKLIVGAVLLFGVQFAFADYTAAGKIVYLYTYDSNRAVVRISGTGATSHGCKFSNYYLIDNTDTSGNTLYAAALTAYTTGRRVKLGYRTGSSATCSGWWGTNSLSPIYSIFFH